MQDTDTETTPGPADVRDLAPTLTVLVVSLVVAAIGVYELCGFGLHSLDRRPHLFSDGLATGGVIVAVVAAGAAVGNLAWHLAAARRGAHGPTGSPYGPTGSLHGPAGSLHGPAGSPAARPTARPSASPDEAG